MSEPKLADYGGTGRITTLVDEAESAIRTLKLRLDSLRCSRNEIERVVPADVAAQVWGAKYELDGARGYLAGEPELARLPSEFIENELEELISAHQYALGKLEEKYAGNWFDALKRHKNAVTMQTAGIALGKCRQELEIKTAELEKLRLTKYGAAGTIENKTDGEKHG